MAYVEFPNKIGITVVPSSTFPVVITITNTTINAVGESLGFIGQIQLSSGPGTSKTISSVGGKIWFRVSTATWAAAGSTVRVGIQDVNTSTGIEDGTYDVFDDLVQPTDTLITTSTKEVTMSSGTKTITHGDTIAVVIEMTVRNGTDSLSIERSQLGSIFPYITIDSGSGPTKSSTGTPMCVIQFDDGTIGHFGDWTIIATESNQSFNSGSTPDEYAMVFELPFKCTISSLLVKIAELDTGEEGNVHLIRDPFGSITNMITVALDPDLANGVASPDVYISLEIAEQEILANTVYAVSYRPTTTGARTTRMLTLANSAFRTGLPILVSGATRTDLGAFTQSLTVFPDFGFRINKIDVGSGGGSSETSVAYIG